MDRRTQIGELDAGDDQVGAGAGCGSAGPWSRRMAGATAYTYAAGGFAGNQKAMQLQLQGPDANQLALLALPIADSVRVTPGAVDVGLSTRGQKPA